MGTMEIRVVYEASPGKDLAGAARVLKDALPAIGHQASES